MTSNQPKTPRTLLGVLVVLSVVTVLNLCLVIDARCQLRAATDDQVNAVAREVPTRPWNRMNCVRNSDASNSREPRDSYRSPALHLRAFSHSKLLVRSRICHGSPHFTAVHALICKCLRISRKTTNFYSRFSTAWSRRPSIDVRSSVTVARTP